MGHFCLCLLFGHFQFFNFLFVLLGSFRFFGFGLLYDVVQQQGCVDVEVPIFEIRVAIAFVEHYLRDTFLYQLVVGGPEVEVIAYVQQMLQYRKEIRFRICIRDEILQHFEAVGHIVHVEGDVVKTLYKLLKIVLAYFIKDLKVLLQGIVIAGLHDILELIKFLVKSHTHNFATQMQPKIQIARRVR